MSKFTQLLVDDQGALTPLAAGAVVLGVASAIGWSGERFSPAPTHPRTRRWYKRLDKPDFTPPGPVFALGWSAIELAFGYGGYRLLRRPSSPRRNGALAMWALNNALIASWSALFFGKKATGPSALMAGAMILTAGGYAAVAAEEDRVAAATAAPLVGWLGFASLLAEEVWRRNAD